MKKFDIKERSLEFAARTAWFIDKLSKSPSAIEYGKQLIRSSASIGANVEEADGALSKKDFVNKMGIARREAKESGYWLRLIEKVGLVDKSAQAELVWLIKESTELKLILSAIINKTLNAV